MRKLHFDWIWIIILFGLVVGLWLIFYPKINTEVYEHQASEVLETLNEQIAQAEQKLPLSSTGEEQIYAELAKVMIAYNDQLVQEQELRLTGPKAYEDPALDLAEFGLEADSPIGSISIPSIGLELPLYLGASKENMAKGAVVLGETSLPIGGQNTNCVIAGHRGYCGIPYFRYVDKLKAGDLVYLRNFWTTMVYRVMETVVVESDDIGAILIQENKDLLTLLTCHPYGVGTERLIIYCEQEV